ncbi:MAG TPA: class I SAM-dependent methyltransferase [Bryobacteraceae bacterium]|nr:class I SAM-dependent methyltransferase [Bryobacteraceae bacterium]
MRQTMTGLLAFALLPWFAEAQQPGVHPITGRQYAGTMGMQGAPWLTRASREQEEQPDKALDELKIPRGATVADIGAGVGYMSWRLAGRVGPEGRVYANDIQQPMLDLLRKNVRERHITNVTPVLGEPDDPKLPLGQMDLVLMVDVYHEFSHPQEMLRHIRESLKPDGRMVLLEYRAEDPNVPILKLHKMTVDQVKEEIEPAGFRLDQVIETLPRQHILIFRRKPS